MQSLLQSKDHFTSCCFCFTSSAASASCFFFSCSARKRLLSCSCSFTEYLSSWSFCSGLTSCTACTQTHNQEVTFTSGSQQSDRRPHVHAARAHLDLGVQQGALLQALIEQTHLFDGVAADAVGIVVFAEQQAAQQSGILKTRGSLTLQHRGGRAKGLRLQWETRTIRHTERRRTHACVYWCEGDYVLQPCFFCHPPSWKAETCSEQWPYIKERRGFQVWQVKLWKISWFSKSALESLRGSFQCAGAAAVSTGWVTELQINFSFTLLFFADGTGSWSGLLLLQGAQRSSLVAPSQHLSCCFFSISLK